MSKPTVLYFGASRGVAFAGYASLAEQRPDLHHVLLLRSVSRFQDTEEFKSLSEDVRARSTYFEGDAHSAENVRDVLKVAGDRLVAIVSSVGFTPPSSLTGFFGVLINGFTPADLCCRALTILVTELNKVYPTLSTKPKFILCSSMGMGKKAHKVLAFGLGPMYTLTLQPFHDDKISMELVMDKVMLPSSSSSPIPRFFPDRDEALPKILPQSTYEALPAPFIPQEDVCVMRPALMTDGPLKGWSAGTGSEGYRVFQEGPGADETKGKKLYSIGRKDCGDFLATMLAGKDESKTAVWWGRQPVIGY